MSANIKMNVKYRTESKKQIRWDLANLAEQAYDTAEEKGFHEPIGHEYTEQATRILLIISELTEAFDDIRKGNEEHVPEEIADVMIRLLHFAAYEGIDLDAEVAKKMEINRGRPHKHGNRF